MSNFKIYLAGKMSGLTFEEMNSWRAKASVILEGYGEYIHTENPCHYYNFEIDPNSFSDHECKEFDLWLVKNCDLILVNLDFSDSIGTAIEIELASRIWNIPIIAFGTRKDIHPWIKLSITKHCPTMEEAIEHIINFYLPNK